jgi:hypothetical protein
VSAELKGLKNNVSKLNQYLKTAERQSVKEAILTESNSISAKIKSFYGTITEQTLNEIKWFAIVAGKQTICLWKTG